jgi:PAS domain S-box-containing protein
MDGLNPDGEAEYRALIENTSDIVWVIDRHGRVRYQSPAVTRVLGYEQNELVGEDAFEYLHPSDREEASELFRQLIESEEATTERFEFRFRHADGSWVWLESIGSNETDTDLGGYVVTSRDVTDRRRLETRFRTFVEQSSDVVTVLDDDGTNRYVSPSVERILGYTPGTLVGRSPFEMVHPDDADTVTTAFERVVSEASASTTIDYRFRHADGSWVWLESRGRSLPTDLGLEGRVVVNSRDVTERKERERELQQRNERLDEFASIVSHDLRNPLTVLQGGLELAERTGEDEHFERCRRAVDRMERIIGDILTLARYDEPDERETVALEPLATDAWETVETADADLDVADDRRFEADRGQARELVENLFRNAVEHGGSDVTVTVGTTDDRVYVEDDGPGFPDADADLFEPGYSTEPSGTGFGLNIVERIAEVHGWGVEATDGTDGGARVELVGVEFQ